MAVFEKFALELKHADTSAFNLQDELKSRPHTIDLTAKLTSPQNRILFITNRPNFLL
jgi:hypothetical protein